MSWQIIRKLLITGILIISLTMLYIVLKNYIKHKIKKWKQ